MGLKKVNLDIEMDFTFEIFTLNLKFFERLFLV
jgi:hypothetical protein